MLEMVCLAVTLLSFVPLNITPPNSVPLNPAIGDQNLVSRLIVLVEIL